MLLTKIDPDTIVGIVFGVIGAAGAVPGVAMIVQHIRNRRARSRNPLNDLENGQSSIPASNHEDDHVAILRLLQLGLDHPQVHDNDVIQHPERVAFVHFHHGIPLVTMNSSAFHPFSLHQAVAEENNRTTGPVSMPTPAAISEITAPFPTDLSSITTQDTSHSLSATSDTLGVSSPTPRQSGVPRIMQDTGDVPRSPPSPIRYSSNVDTATLREFSKSADDLENQPSFFSTSSSTTPKRGG